MTSLAEYFQAFHKYAVENDLPASSRNLYYTILGELNAKFWKVESLSISVRDMQILGGFQSSSTVERAKTILGTENIVKTKKLKNRKTQYELVEPQNWLRNNNGTPEKQLRHTEETPAAHLQNTALSSIPSISITKNKTERSKDEEDRVHASDSGGDDEIPCSRKIRVEWINATGVNPSDRVSWDLGEMEQRHGTEKLTEAIRKAVRADSNGGNGINIEFVQSKLNQLVYGKKGEQKNGNSSGRRSEYENLK